MTKGLALRDLQPRCAHARRQVFHADLNLAIKSITALHRDLKGACLTRTQGHRLGKRGAVSVAQCHVNSPGSK
jgi:hypothetical protein